MIGAFLAAQDAEAEEYRSAADLSAFRAGGTLEWYARPKTADALRGILRYAKQESLPVKVIGRGSNLIFSDRLHEGIFLGTEKLCSLFCGEDFVKLSAGVFFPRAVRFLARRGVSLAESMAGIPGSVGGLVRQNAGAFGQEMRDIFISAEIYRFETNKTDEYSSNQMTFTYRGSCLSHTCDVLLCATLRTHADDPAAIRARLQSFAARRRAAQPTGLASLGSFFTRPEGEFAARLIDACGLKGLTVGGAAVSEKHAGFLVNLGGASATDLFRLAERVRETVFKETGVLLADEAEIVS